MGDKIPAFIILTNDHDTGDGQEDREERDGGSVLSDGMPGRKAPLSEEDGRQFAGSLTLPPLSAIPLFFVSFSFSRLLLAPLPPCFLSPSLFLLLFAAVILLYFSEEGDTTQLLEKTLRQFPAPISIIAGVLRLEGEPISGPSFVVHCFLPPSLLFGPESVDALGLFQSLCDSRSLPPYSQSPSHHYTNLDAIDVN